MDRRTNYTSRGAHRHPLPLMKRGEWWRGFGWRARTWFHRIESWSMANFKDVLHYVQTFNLGNGWRLSRTVLRKGPRTFLMSPSWLGGTETICATRNGEPVDFATGVIPSPLGFWMDFFKVKHVSFRSVWCRVWQLSTHQLREGMGVRRQQNI